MKYTKQDVLVILLDLIWVIAMVPSLYVAYFPITSDVSTASFFLILFMVVSGSVLWPLTRRINKKYRH